MIDEPERGKLQWRMIDCVTNIGHVSSVPVGHGLFSFSFVCRPGVGACGVRGVRRGGRECWVERQLSGVVELSDESTSRFRFQASVRGVEQGVRLQRSRKGAVEADVGK